MSDTFRIIPYVVRSAGTDVPPEEVQAAVNSLAQQTTIALNSVASDPTGPAGGDLSGTYPNPTVAAVHATSGTMSGVTVNSSPIGQTTPAAGAFTTLTATTPVAPTSGGTGRNALTANAVLIGEGSSQVNFAAPGAAGTLLASNGVAADPTFQTAAALNLALTTNPLSQFANTTSAQLAGVITDETGTAGSLVFSVSPVLTGTPAIAAATATTAAAHTNTTQVATTAFVETEFASPPVAGVGSVTPSPGAFTTLSATSTVSGAGFTARFSTPGPIGNTTPSTGAFTTLSSTGTFTPSSTNGIVGTTTNDNANAGSVGEHVSNTTTGTSLSTGVTANATSISLTAGDWDVSGTAFFTAGGTTTVSGILCGVNNVSATPGVTGTFNQLNATLTTGGAQRYSSPVFRFSLSATTTIFLVVQATFGVSTMTVDGFIRARRVR